MADREDTNQPGIKLRCTLRGPTGRINGIGWSPDGRTLASPSEDKSIYLWDLNTAELCRTFDGHPDKVNCVAWSPDDEALAWGAEDGTVGVWDLESAELRWCQQGNFGRILSLAWLAGGQKLAAAVQNAGVALWDADTGYNRERLDGEIPIVRSLALSPDGDSFATASGDHTIRLWDAWTCRLRGSLRGRGLEVFSVAWSPDGLRIAAASRDRTIHLWRAISERLTGILEGHTGSVTCVAFSADSSLLASKSDDGTVRLWRCATGEAVAVIDEPASAFWLSGLAFHPTAPILATLGEEDRVIRVWDIDLDILLAPCLAARQSYNVSARAFIVAPPVYYTNAKIVLVGDSGVGKSALGLILSGHPFVPTESTHGRHVWAIGSREAELEDGRKQTCETFLWDMAGQPGYRILHQLHLDEVAVALVLFDASSETDPFAGVAYWARALDQATRGFPLVKYLVASRTDRGGMSVSRERVAEVLARYGFAGFFETSAKRGDGTTELVKAIHSAIPWHQLPLVSAPQLFQDMKAFVVQQKGQGQVLPRREELLARYRAARPGAEAPEEVFDTCLGRLEAASLVKRLTFGGLVLLQPEMLDDYCGWLALAARREHDGLGCIVERRAFDGDFPMDAERRLTDPTAEHLMLVATVEEVLGRGIAIRQPTDGGEMLVFPTEVRTDMPNDLGDHIPAVRFQFEGPVGAIYAGLAVSLMYSRAFKSDRLYKNAATFRGTRGQGCGFAVEYPDSGNAALGRLTVFFEASVEKDIKLLFLRYVDQQLEERVLAGSVKRERVYQCVCPTRYVIPSDVVTLRKDLGKTTVPCPICERHLPLDDLAEETGRQDDRVDAIEAEGFEERERQKRLAVLTERARGSEFHVVLCHNSKDKPEVRQLASKLRDQGILPWIDEEGILAGRQFIPEIEDIIDRVPAVAVMVGPHWLGRWQQQEYYAFLQRFVEGSPDRGRHLRLIPVLLPGAPEKPELPVFLRGFNYVDFRKAGLDDREALGKMIRAILSEGADM